MLRRMIKVAATFFHESAVCSIYTRFFPLCFLFFDFALFFVPAGMRVVTLVLFEESAINSISALIGLHYAKLGV